jgi:ubiquinone/menaquinone biosynthesis C-methylase UbiE
LVGIYDSELRGCGQQNGPNPDYSVLTERPGLGATEEQIERIYQRYCFSREFADGKDVLEVACGSGMGLRFLAETGNRVVGVDIDKKNVEEAALLRNGADSNNSKREINLAVMDAHSLSFQNGSFDVVLILESIYYLTKPLEFVREAARVMKRGGVLIIATVNKNWSAFHPSPYSCRYFSAPELYEMLKGFFVDISLYGGFPTLAPGVKAQAVQCIKQIAVKLNLIPRTLKGRELLKRIFLGKVRSVPHGIVEGMVKYERPTPISHDRPNTDSKILYVVAKKEA